MGSTRTAGQRPSSPARCTSDDGDAGRAASDSIWQRPNNSAKNVFTEACRSCPPLGPLKRGRSPCHSASSLSTSGWRCAARCSLREEPTGVGEPRRQERLAPPQAGPCRPPTSPGRSACVRAPTGQPRRAARPCHRSGCRWPGPTPRPAAAMSATVAPSKPSSTHDATAARQQAVPGATPSSSTFGGRPTGRSATDATLVALPSVAMHEVLDRPTIHRPEPFPSGQPIGMIAAMRTDAGHRRAPRGRSARRSCAAS